MWTMRETIEMVSWVLFILFPGVKTPGYSVFG